VALITPGSAFAREWKRVTPTYGIYEYAKASDGRELRFGDGSWQILNARHIADLVLLDACGTELSSACSATDPCRLCPSTSTRELCHAFRRE